MPLDRRAIAVDVGCVHAQKELALGNPVDGHIVEYATFGVAEHSVADAADSKRRDVARQEPLGARDRRSARQMELSHVRDVEEPRALSDGRVLLEDGAVLDGHLPARERNEAPA